MTGEAVCYLVLGGYEINLQQSFKNSFSQKVIINFNVFHSCMKNWIG
jgi:hypothetical protein